MADAASNPDHEALRRFVADPSVPCALATNPLAADLRTTLQHWDAEARCLVLRFTPGERQLQGRGVVQGGIVTTMLDFGLAFCVLALLQPPKTAATVALNVHFEQAVPAGEVEVRARIDRLGGRLAFASAELRPVDAAQACARATATLAIGG